MIEYMFSGDKNSSIIKSLLVFVSVIAAVSIGIRTDMAVSILIPIILIAALFTYLTGHPLSGLFILVVILPFTRSGYLNNTIGNVPGLRPSVLLPLLIALCLILFAKSYKIGFFEIFFIVIMYGFFTVSVIKGFSYIRYILTEYGLEDNNTMGFLQYQYILPILFFMPYILVIKFLRSEKNIENLINACFINLFILSAIVIFVFIFLVSDKTDFEVVRNIYGKIINMHGNSLANFYITIIPILLANILIRKNILNITTLIMSIFVIGIIYSRTAYYMIFINIVFLLYMLKKKRYIPVVIIIIVIFLIAATPLGIVDRLMTGFENNDISTISAGRNILWEELIDIIKRNPKMFIFGMGYDAIKNPYVSDMLTYKLGHSHNMYLDMVLESGFVGLIIFTLIFIVFIVKFYLSHIKTKNIFIKYNLIAIEISVISYMVSGLSGRTFYPTLDNILFWVLLAIGTVLTYKVRNENKEVLQ